MNIDFTPTNRRVLGLQRQGQQSRNMIPLRKPRESFPEVVAEETNPHAETVYFDTTTTPGSVIVRCHPFICSHYDITNSITKVASYADGAGDLVGHPSATLTDGDWRVWATKTYTAPTSFTLEVECGLIGTYPVNDGQTGTAPDAVIVTTLATFTVSGTGGTPVISNYVPYFDGGEHTYSGQGYLATVPTIDCVKTTVPGGTTFDTERGYAATGAGAFNESNYGIVEVNFAIGYWAYNEPITAADALVVAQIWNGATWQNTAIAWSSQCHGMVSYGVFLVYLGNYQIISGTFCVPKGKKYRITKLVDNTDNADLTLGLWQEVSFTLTGAGIQTVTATDATINVTGTTLNPTIAVDVGVGANQIVQRNGSGNMPQLNPAAGTATVAPILLSAGTSLTAPVVGAMEWDGTDLYITTP